MEGPRSRRRELQGGDRERRIEGLFRTWGRGSVQGARLPSSFWNTVLQRGGWWDINGDLRRAPTPARPTRSRPPLRRRHPADRREVPPDAVRDDRDDGRQGRAPPVAAGHARPDHDGNMADVGRDQFEEGRGDGHQGGRRREGDGVGAGRSRRSHIRIRGYRPTWWRYLSDRDTRAAGGTPRTGARTCCRYSRWSRSRRPARSPGRRRA